MFDVGRVGWIFILRGMLALLLALLTLGSPGLGLKALVFTFGLYCFMDGIFTLGTAFRHADEGERPWVALLVGGFASLVVGLAGLALIETAALVALTLVAGWAAFTGAMWMVAAIYLRKHVAEEWMLAGSGVLSVVFAVALVLFSDAAAAALVLWIGAYALVYGLLLIALGLKLRTWMKEGLDEFQHRFSPASQYYVH